MHPLSSRLSNNKEGNHETNITFEAFKARDLETQLGYPQENSPRKYTTKRPCNIRNFHAFLGHSKNVKFVSHIAAFTYILIWYTCLWFVQTRVQKNGIQSLNYMKVHDIIYCAMFFKFQQALEGSNSKIIASVLHSMQDPPPDFYQLPYKSNAIHVWEMIEISDTGSCLCFRIILIYVFTSLLPFM